MPAMAAANHGTIIDRFFNTAEFNTYTVPEVITRSKFKQRKKSNKCSKVQPPTSPCHSSDRRSNPSKAQMPKVLLSMLDRNNSKTYDDTEVTMTPWPKYNYNLLTPHAQDVGLKRSQSASSSFALRPTVYQKRYSPHSYSGSVQSDDSHRSRSTSNSSGGSTSSRMNRPRSRSRSMSRPKSRSRPSSPAKSKDFHKEKSSQHAKSAKPRHKSVSKKKSHALRRPKSSPGKLEGAINANTNAAGNHSHQLRKAAGPATEYDDPSAIFHLCMATAEEAHYWSLKCDTLKRTRATSYYYFLSDHRRNNCRCCRNQLADELKKLCLSSGSRVARNRTSSHAFVSGYEGIEAPVRPDAAKAMLKS